MINDTVSADNAPLQSHCQAQKELKHSDKYELDNNQPLPALSIPE